MDRWFVLPTVGMFAATPPAHPTVFVGGPLRARLEKVFRAEPDRPFAASDLAWLLSEETRPVHQALQTLKRNGVIECAGRRRLPPRLAGKGNPYEVVYRLAPGGRST